ncbi:reverse transcriptase domain-containing protein [Tanacetum coccineum]
MATNRTMAQKATSSHRGIRRCQLINKFTGRQDPHNHLRFFNKVTSTFRHPEVPNTSIKLLLFPFSLDGEARDWLDKEPPRSILTWDDLVSKFINQFFPPSKTTLATSKQNHYFLNQERIKPCKTKHGNVAKNILCQCPHDGFPWNNTNHDTFTILLNTNDQRCLRFAVGGNFQDKMPSRRFLAIIEKINRKVADTQESVQKITRSSNANAPSSTILHLLIFLSMIHKWPPYFEDKMNIRMSRLEKRLLKRIYDSATVKAVEEVLVTVLDFLRTQLRYANPSLPEYNPIVFKSSLTHTPFGYSDFLLLEAAELFLAIAMIQLHQKLNEAYYEPEETFSFSRSLLI